MMANRLADSASPYLAQHADNPVDWFMWGEDAFEEARRRDVPIFLSVGYSACHWCHVMAHESFEEDAVAAVMNANFVNVKVDREERPDVDAVYMDAVTALTGRGGWPMSVFLAPDGRPFYGGTYWPSEGRHGMPAFVDVLEAVHDAWTERRDEVEASVAKITDALSRQVSRGGESALDLRVVDRAARLLTERAWDRARGGFGAAPKFPQAMTIEFLLDHHLRSGEESSLEAAVHSLKAMARGGIHDQLAGGFARYSTDARWLVPHFEKMLYDNALLLSAYARAASITTDPQLAEVARSIATYLMRDMQDELGGFYSATDADSEGVEGKYFVWSADEFAQVVGSAEADPDLLAEYFGVTPGGNFEGENILTVEVSADAFAAARALDASAFAADLSRARDALLVRRSGRVPPGLDHKVLTSWNALAIRGLARAGAYLGQPTFIAQAEKTARFLRSNVLVNGRLAHVWNTGAASVPAFLDDLAGLGVALLDLYAVTGINEWFRWAVDLAEQARLGFRDPDGGFFQTADDAEQLYRRPKDTWDNATPSGNSLMAELCAKLGAYTGDASWVDEAESILRLHQAEIEASPTGFGWLAQVAEFRLAGPREVAIVGEPGPAREELLSEVWRRPLAGTIVALADPAGMTGEVPLLAGKTDVGGRPAAYVCHDFACERPVTSAWDLAELLD